MGSAGSIEKQRLAIRGIRRNNTFRLRKLEIFRIQTVCPSHRRTAKNHNYLLQRPLTGVALPLPMNCIIYPDAPPAIGLLFMD
jgi:hypothetical protein